MGTKFTNRFDLNLHRLEPYVLVCITDDMDPLKDFQSHPQVAERGAEGHFQQRLGGHSNCPGERGQLHLPRRHWQQLRVQVG